MDGSPKPNVLDVPVLWLGNNNRFEIIQCILTRRMPYARPCARLWRSKECLGCAHSWGRPRSCLWWPSELVCRSYTLDHQDSESCVSMGS